MNMAAHLYAATGSRLAASIALGLRARSCKCKQVCPRALRLFVYATATAEHGSVGLPKKRSPQSVACPKPGKPLTHVLVPHPLVYTRSHSSTITSAAAATARSSSATTHSAANNTASTILVAAAAFAA